MPDEGEVLSPEIPAASSLADVATPPESGAPEDETAGVTAAPETPEHSEKPKGGFQRRIDKLTREKADKERELEYWRQEALRTKPEPKAVSDPAKPVVDKYPTYEEYVEALADWKAEQALAKFKAAQDKSANEAKQKSEQQTRAERWNGKAAEARKVHADFDEVAFSDETPVNQQMVDAMMEADNGAEVAYYLGKNPEEAARIAKLPPVKALLEMGKIVARVTGEPAAHKEPPVTKAPAPVQPVLKPTGTATVDLNDPNITKEQFSKEWDRQFGKR